MSNPDITTTGADSSPIASIPFDQPLALTASGEPLLNHRSCVHCRRRRVRCDKTMPCGNCRRSLINCDFPTRPPRYPKGDAEALLRSGANEREAELMRRLHKLEGRIAELRSQLGSDDSVLVETDSDGGLAMETMAVNQAGSRPFQPSRSGLALVRETVAQVKQKTQSPDFANIAQGDDGTMPAYAGGKSLGFWPRLDGELDQLRDEIYGAIENLHSQGQNAPQGSLSPAPREGEDGLDHRTFISGYSTADVDLAGLHPEFPQILSLWQVYLVNVHPLLQVFYLPTVEKLIQGLASGVCHLDAAEQALCFVIYYSAVTSMEEQEVRDMTGFSKGQCVERFQFGLEQAWAKANILTVFDIRLLQSLSIFLTMVKCNDDSKLCWTLTALAIHLAKALGLHRDGVRLGLSPHDTQIRRRVWWAILAVDLRCAQEMGSALGVGDASFDTQLPSNFDNDEIDPSVRETSSPGEGPTDATTCVVRYEVEALARALFIEMLKMGPVSHNVEKVLEEREGMLLEIYDRFEEKFLKYAATDDDPLVWMASLISRVIMAKMGLIIYQPVLFPGTGPCLSNDIRTRLWILAIEVVEYNDILNTDPRGRHWRWLFKSYRQWAALAYMLLEASRQPWTVTSERAWEVAQILRYDHPMDGAQSPGHTAVWMPIKLLYKKAKQHRESEIARLIADPEAARQLDAQGRLNPVLDRLGPVPGMESRTAELRKRWRVLVGLKLSSSKPMVGSSLVPASSSMLVGSPGKTTSVPTDTGGSKPAESSVTSEQIKISAGGSFRTRSDTDQSLIQLPDSFSAPLKGGGISQGHPGGKAGGTEESIWMPTEGGGEYPTYSAIPYLGRQDDYLQEGMINYGQIPPPENHLLDFETNMAGLEDIDWNHWQRSVTALSLPAQGGEHGSQ